MSDIVYLREQLSKLSKLSKLKEQLKAQLTDIPGLRDNLKTQLVEISQLIQYLQSQHVKLAQLQFNLSEYIRSEQNELVNIQQTQQTQQIQNNQQIQNDQKIFQLTENINQLNIQKHNIACQQEQFATELAEQQITEQQFTIQLANLPFFEQQLYQQLTKLQLAQQQLVKLYSHKQSSRYLDSFGAISIECHSGKIIDDDWVC